MMLLKPSRATPATAMLAVTQISDATPTLITNYIYCLSVLICMRRALCFMWCALLPMCRNSGGVDNAVVEQAEYYLT